MVTSLYECICRCHCLCLCICVCHCIFFGQVMSPHHSDQMSQGSQVSRVTLLLCFSKGVSLSHSVSDKVTYWAVGWTAKNRQLSFGRKNKLIPWFQTFQAIFNWHKFCNSDTASGTVSWGGTRFVQYQSTNNVLDFCQNRQLSFGTNNKLIAWIQTFCFATLPLASRTVSSVGTSFSKITINTASSNVDINFENPLN